MPGKKEKQPLSVTHPELAKEANGWDPASYSKGSGAELKWECKNGHIFDSIVSNRVKGNGCPYCANKKVLRGFNDLATTHPELAKLIVETNPETIIFGINKKQKWICQMGHISSSLPKNFKGCSICKSLQQTHPEIASEAFGWDPSLFSSGSGLKKEWKCQKGHKWQAAIYSRSAGRGCPVCSNYKVVAGINDLVTTHPQIASEANGWNPRIFHSGSTKKVSWKCKQGHIWDAIIDSRSRGRGCPYCTGRRSTKGVSDLKTLNPGLASEAFDWDPSTLTIQSGQLRKWKCRLGHIWESSPHNRRKNNCPICANRKLLQGFNDLETIHPELAKEADGWDPKTFIAGTKTKLNWVCANGHKWSALLSNRAKGIGCPTCARTSFDPNSDGWIYLLDSENWSMHKIGITNNPHNRVNLHLSRGWELKDLRGPIDGHLAQQWERAILRMLKAKGADLSNSKIAGKFDGYSEAWSRSTFEVKSIKELMKLTEEFEEN